MEVSQYLFQSPSSSQVQVGRPDPSSKQSEPTKQESTTQSNASVPNESLKNAQSFQATQTQEVTPTVESSEPVNGLDVYA